jgi:hypothetical protein
MSEPRLGDRCPAPRLNDDVTEFCFGDLTPERRDAVALHLLECPVCVAQVERLSACVQAAKFDPRVKPLAISPATLSIFGLAGRFEQVFGGHVRYVLVASALYALLYAVPVLVEIAYQWNRFGQAAVPLSLATFGWVFSTTLLAFWLQARALQRRTRPVGVLVLALATVALCAVLVPFFPTEPVTLARFNTYPTKLAYFKAVFQAWMVGPVFALWTFHAGLTVQRELSLGRHRQVWALLQGDRTGMPLRGLRLPTVAGLGIYFGGLTAYNAVGLSHLFDNLIQGHYTTLFMTLVSIRATVWFLLPALCLWWFWGRLDDLKREAAAVMALARNNRSAGRY